MIYSDKANRINLYHCWKLLVSMTYRHEFKYTLNVADYLIVRERLKHIAELDSHADASGTYKVRSLYFETPTDKVLNEKLYGIPEREKFRIRLYNNDTYFLRLEKKIKNINATKKITCPISRKETNAILSGEFDWMLDSQSALIAELYAKMAYQQLRPRTIVEYDRECWIYDPGNVRITFDMNLSTGITSTDFLNPDVVLTKALENPLVIMEVKYDAYLPTIIRGMIQVSNRRMSAFSKYATARILG